MFKRTIFRGAGFVNSLIKRNISRMPKLYSLHVPNNAFRDAKPTFNNLYTYTYNLVENFTYRQLGRSDLKVVLQWMLQENWPLSENTLHCVYDACPSGGTAAVNADGKIVGCIFADKTGTDIPVGWLIIHPDWQKHGIASKLSQFILDSNRGKNLFCNGVENSVGHYKTLGFNVADFEFATFVGVVKKEKIQHSGNNKHHIQKLTSDKMQLLLDYDESIYLRPRKLFMEQWTNSAITTTLLATNEAGDMVGYGCLQKLTDDMAYIAPLYAENTTVANDLTVRIVNEIPEGKNTMINIPLSNSFMVNFANQLHLKTVLKMQRLYTDRRVALDLSKVYGITGVDTPVI